MDIKAFMKIEGEKPLDNIVSDGGFCSIFRTIACVGDSLSSGEFESRDAEDNRTYHDLYEYSWGQYIARMTGSKVYNFSQGGMTASAYCDTFARKNGFWGADKVAQAYIIALGANDVNKIELGTIEDICLDDYTKSKPTFAGYYAQIVQRYKEISPDARFFFMAMPKSDSADHNKKALAHRELLKAMTELFSHSYLIDLYEYAPIYDAEFRDAFYLRGHLNPCGYLLTAKMTASYIDYIIRNNPDEFRRVGFINTGIETGF